MAEKMKIHNSPHFRRAARIAMGMKIKRMLIGRSRTKARKFTGLFPFLAEIRSPNLSYKPQQILPDFVPWGKADHPRKLSPVKNPTRKLS